MNRRLGFNTYPMSLFLRYTYGQIAEGVLSFSIVLKFNVPCLLLSRSRLPEVSVVPVAFAVGAGAEE